MTTVPYSTWEKRLQGEASSHVMPVCKWILRPLWKVSRCTNQPSMILQNQQANGQKILTLVLRRMTQDKPVSAAQSSSDNI